MHPIALLFPAIASLLHAAAATNATDLAACAPAACGNLTITYPFWLGGHQGPGCGYPAFELACDGRGNRTFLTKTFRSFLYRVTDIFYDNSSLAVVVDSAAATGGCYVPDFNASSSLSLFPLNISRLNMELSFLYNCSPSGYKPGCSEYQVPCARGHAYVRLARKFSGDGDGDGARVVGGNCSVSTVPVRSRDTACAEDFKELMAHGFLLEWKVLGNCSACMRSGGRCAFDGEKAGFQCLCSDGVHHATCDDLTNKRSLMIKIGAGIAAGILCLIILSFVGLLWHYLRRRRRCPPLDRLIRHGSSTVSSLKDFNLAGSPRTHIFNYEELEEATDGFSEERELGVGGFGTVYRGTLRDGSIVAVKRLYKNSYRGAEQFMNEVDILSRLRHPNLVTLYGCSCQSCDDLLLVYEYVPNGTLADHLHGARAATQPLAWRTRISIAVETAEALNYLHAVEPQVIHRDVKTTNILLDQEFHVKVADFGLSRLSPVDATHVSTAPQGTPGYVDPMYHQCYQLTDKSDVYSFGVVLVELISSKPAVDMKRCGGEINLASMAVNKIQSYDLDHLVDPELGYRSDEETRQTVDLVAELSFRCLQQERDVRPPIKEVLEVLRGIQKRGVKMETDVCVKEDAQLLKNSCRDCSPDSVMHQWTTSSSTTPTASG